VSEFAAYLEELMMSSGNDLSEAEIREILNRHRNDLMSSPNVTGVGIQQETTPEGKVYEFIQVYVSEKVPPDQIKPSDRIPELLEGVEVRILEIGQLGIEEIQ
jgi:hypothetical protein